MKKPKILIVDDEQFVREILFECLKDEYACVTADSFEDAREKFAAGGFAVVLSDIDLGSGSGIDLVPEILEKSPETVVILISGNQTYDNAMEAAWAGAFEFIGKPFDLNVAAAAVGRAVRRHRSLAAGKAGKKNSEPDMPPTLCTNPA